LTAKADQGELFAKPRKNTILKGDGYAGTPGTGPAGETCKSCARLKRCDLTRTKTVYKCGLCKAAWKPSTDIVLHAPACAFWQAGAGSQTKKGTNAER